MTTHSTAIVESGAELAADVEIGPFCYVGPKVSLKSGVVLKSNVVVEGRTEIGERTIVHPFSVLGGAPQHLNYGGEDTRLVIGADNIIREHVTMSLGTVSGLGETKIGKNGFFMVAAHIAHDCVIGDNVIFANNATLGGHVVIEDNAFLGGLCAVHQFCRIGAFAFIGGCAAVPTDVIPHGSAIGNHAHLNGLNLVGMKRLGLSRAVIHDIRGAYRMFFHADGAFRDRIEAVDARYGECGEVKRILQFIRAKSTRPLMTPER